MVPEIKLWTLDEDGGTHEISPSEVALESQIDEALERDPTILGFKLLIIAKQLPVTIGTAADKSTTRRLDLLAINESGSLVVIENKRTIANRETIAQTLEYAAWANNVTIDKIAKTYTSYSSNGNYDTEDIPTEKTVQLLVNAYAERFRESTDEDDVEEHLRTGIEQGTPDMLIVATELDSATALTINFLADVYRVAINAVLFQVFEHPDDSTKRILGRTFLHSYKSDILHDSKLRATRTKAKQQERTTYKRFWNAWYDYTNENQGITTSTIGFDPASRNRGKLNSSTFVQSTVGINTHNIGLKSIIWSTKLALSSKKVTPKIVFIADKETNSEIVDYINQELDQHNDDEEWQLISQVKESLPKLEEVTERVTISTEPITVDDLDNPTYEELKYLTGSHIDLYKIMKKLISGACENIAANKPAHTEDSHDSR